MEPETIFTILNLLPLPVWLLWIAAPRSRPARALAHSLWPFVGLGAIYAALLAYALAAGGPAEGSSFTSLAGVMALFASPWGVLAGWAHYLCLDLFVARWILRDAPEAGYRLSPILTLTLMAGPAGLLLYLALRRWLRPAGEPAC